MKSVAAVAAIAVLVLACAQFTEAGMMVARESLEEDVSLEYTSMVNSDAYVFAELEAFADPAAPAAPVAAPAAANATAANTTAPVAVANATKPAKASNATKKAKKSKKAKKAKNGTKKAKKSKNSTKKAKAAVVPVVANITKPAKANATKPAKPAAANVTKAAKPAAANATAANATATNATANATAVAPLGKKAPKVALLDLAAGKKPAAKKAAAKKAAKGKGKGKGAKKPAAKKAKKAAKKGAKKAKKSKKAVKKGKKGKKGAKKGGKKGKGKGKKPANDGTTVVEERPQCPTGPADKKEECIQLEKAKVEEKYRKSRQDTAKTLLAEANAIVSQSVAISDENIRMMQGCEKEPHMAPCAKTHMNIQKLLNKLADQLKLSDKNIKARMAHSRKYKFKALDVTKSIDFVAPKPKKEKK